LAQGALASPSTIQQQNASSLAAFSESGTVKFYTGIGIYTADNTNFDIGNASASLLRIQTGGNVGIGTLTPCIVHSRANAFEVNSSGTVLAGIWNGTPIADAYLTLTYESVLLKTGAYPVVAGDDRTLIYLAGDSYYDLTIQSAAPIARTFAPKSSICRRSVGTNVVTGGTNMSSFRSKKPLLLNPGRGDGCAYYCPVSRFRRAVLPFIVTIVMMQTKDAANDGCSSASSIRDSRRRGHIITSRVDPSDPDRQSTYSFIVQDRRRIHSPCAVHC